MQGSFSTKDPRPSEERCPSCPQLDRVLSRTPGSGELSILETLGIHDPCKAPPQEALSPQLIQGSPTPQGCFSEPEEGVFPRPLTCSVSSPCTLRCD